MENNNTSIIDSINKIDKPNQDKKSLSEITLVDTFKLMRHVYIMLVALRLQLRQSNISLTPLTQEIQKSAEKAVDKMLDINMDSDE